MLSCTTPDVRSLRPELDRRLAAVVESCLERERDCRFSSAEELAGALSAFRSEPLSSPEDFSLSPYEVSDEEAVWLQAPWGGPQGMHAAFPPVREQLAPTWDTRKDRGTTFRTAVIDRVAPTSHLWCFGPYWPRFRSK
jgi:hypothetical protein